MSRMTFLSSPVTVFVSSQTSSVVINTFRSELNDLGLSFEVVRCEQVEPIRLYHQGDIIYGNRLEDFLGYARWLVRTAD